MSVKKYNRRFRVKALSDSWQIILYREVWQGTDNAFSKHLNQSLDDTGEAWGRRASRPSTIEVEIALRQGCRHNSSFEKHWRQPLDRLYREKHKPTSIEDRIAALRADSWLDRFLARHALLHQGGEAIPAMEDALDSWSWANDKATLRWLLAGISHDTSVRLGPEADRLRCTRCLTFCINHNIDLPWQKDINFCGCRSCRQTRSFYHAPHGTVVVLDEQQTTPLHQALGKLYVKWETYPQPFDFNQVEIGQTTDESVERFAMRIGNDTDPVRRPGYASTNCRLRPQHSISSNSIKVLNAVFGEVR